MQCLSNLAFLFGLYLNNTFKICSIDLNNSLKHLLVESLKIHIPLSLFNILEYSFCQLVLIVGFKTQDKWVSCFLLWYFNCECTHQFFFIFCFCVLHNIHNILLSFLLLSWSVLNLSNPFESSIFTLYHLVTIGLNFISFFAFVIYTIFKLSF